MSENIKLTINEINEIESPFEKGCMYWYQKNITDIPEIVIILEKYNDNNNYYYTIQIKKDKTEKQTIGKYLFNFKSPPKYSLLPGENYDRIKSIMRFSNIQGQILAQKCDDRKEWRFEDIMPKNEEERKRLNCFYNKGYNKGHYDAICNQFRDTQDPKDPFNTFLK
jgi:hypothetical protein